MTSASRLSRTISPGERGVAGQRRAPTVLRARVGSEPLSADGHSSVVRDNRCGAVVCFTGVVRDHDGGRGVRALEYLAHPSAERRLAEIAASVLAPAEEPGDVRVAISHRIGALAIGDLALVCAVASPHRTAAFVHCGELVERVKSELPIWKRQLFVDGTDEWVNCP